MRSFNLLRTWSLVGLGVLGAIAACGSDDGKKRVARANSDAGEAGAEPGSSSDGGFAGVAASGGAAGGEVNTAGSGEGGHAPMAGAAGTAGDGGTTDPGPRECVTGTADCDDDHTDCETNTATDATNCGRCERACGATATCSSGLCDGTVVLSPTGYANWCDAVYSASTAYLLTCWGSFTEVRTTPLTVGANILGEQLATYSLPVTAARGMLIDGNDVLYGVEGSPSYLYKFPLDATGPGDVTIGYTFENATRFDGLQLIGDTFYWSHNTHTGGGQVSPGFIKKRAKAGASSTTLVSDVGLTYGLQVFTGQMVWLELRTLNAALGLYRAPIAGAAIADVKLVATVGGGGYLTRQGDYAYWTDKEAAPNGRIRRLLANDPAAVPEDVATKLDLPEGIVTDDAYVYFKQLDALYRVPLTGGQVEQLSPAIAANDSQATIIHHVDDKYVYFAAGANGGSSVIVRVAK